MDNRYNFYNLEASFRNYLLAGNINQKQLTTITIKNYLSDFRHFIGWLVFKFKVSSFAKALEDEKSPKKIIALITPLLVEEYKSYLVENKIPEKTVNRRLSTVRKFCSFCISQGWMKENPAKQVQNFRPESNRPLVENIKAENLLNQFEKDLIKEKINQSIITNYLNDVQEFLST